MGDAGSERSKAPSLPPRCPCGFWGSSKTMNLCSKCFAEKRNPHNEKVLLTGRSLDLSPPKEYFSTRKVAAEYFSPEENKEASFPAED